MPVTDKEIQARNEARIIPQNKKRSARWSTGVRMTAT